MNLVKSGLNILRQYSTKQKITVELSKNLIDDLETETIKHKNHPGIHQVKCTALPDKIIKAVTLSLKDFPVTAICRESENLHRYLMSRKLPLESNEIRDKRIEIEQKVKIDMGLDKKDLTQEEMEHLTKVKNIKVDQILKQKIYAWKPINYDQYKSLQYLCGRGAFEYAVINKIFAEIVQRNADFKPNSYFDFGSGVGTGVWAASSFWKNSIHEYYLVDSSSHMNDLSDLILRDGDINKEITLKSVYHRQFLPSNNTKYDLVVSAFSLFELQSLEKRKEVLRNLWDKCDGYLIIVENGTSAGFKVIDEARNFILQIAGADNDAHIFSPCPHELKCPRIAANDGTPCNFQITFNNLTFSEEQEVSKDYYSYIVVKRGSANNDDTEKWNRLVRPTLVRPRHTICRMCTENGKLEEVIFTASKHGKMAYRCAKASKLGDRLPFKFHYEEVSENLRSSKSKKKM